MRRNQFLCLLFGVFGLVICGDALDFGKVFKRRPSSRGQGRELDVEEKADEVLRYSTACDKELAKSMVILEEQKGAAEEALVICRDNRETARNDVVFLTLKVETTSQKLADADERCADKMKVAEADANAKMEEIKATLQEREAAMADLKNEHREELQRIASEHKISVQEATENHAKHAESLEKENKEKLSIMKKQMEDQEKDQLNERMAAKATLEAAQADHDEKTQELEQRHKASLEALDKTSKQKIGKIEKQFKTCDGSLTSSQRILESLQRDHERALQKIAVLENVTPVSLAMEQARDFADYARNEIHAFVAPLYDEHLKEHVEKTKQKVDELSLVLSPVVKPLKKGMHKLLDVQQKFAASVLEKTKDFFVKEVCPLSRAQLKELQKKQILHSPVFAEYIEQACSKPTEFFISTGKVVLVIAAFLFHRFIFRTLLSLLLLPLRIVLFPFSFFFSAKKDQQPVTKKA